MIFFSLVLLAIYAPLVYSSTPKPPHLEVNHLQDPTPSSDPLENVRALLSEQITNLSALLSQITGADYLNSYGSESARQTLPFKTNAIPEPSIIPLNVQTPLDGHVEEMQELELVNTNPNTVAGPCIPKEPFPVKPIPNNWYPQLNIHTCNGCQPPIPDTSFCRKFCGISLLYISWPEENNYTWLDVEGAYGSPVPVKASIDLVHFPNFISNCLVHSLGLESNVTPWPAEASDKNSPECPTVKIIGTIPITLANFTKEQLKYKDVFYVFVPLRSTDKLPDLTVGIELLRQTSGLAVHPDVIVLK